MNVTMLLIARSEGILSNLVSINDGDLSFVTIEDLGDLFESRALSLDVEEDDEDELKEDPNLMIVSKWKANVQNRARLTA